MQFMPMATAVAALTLFAAQTAAAQSLEDGERLFKQRCQSCHSVTPGKASPAGPTLIGVVGRASGSADFKYSAAMKEAGLTWDAATLDQYLTALRSWYPGRGCQCRFKIPSSVQRSSNTWPLCKTKTVQN